MKILGREIKLAIFDLDGTLIDSTSLWGEIDAEFFKRRGMKVPKDYGKTIAHMGLLMAARYTRDTYFPNENIEDMINEWTILSRQAYEEHIPLKDHAKEILKLFKDNNVFIALATANSKELYMPCIDRLHISKYFSYVIDVTSCKEGKNSPEIYDKACDYFRVKREETIIFEDMLLPLKTAYNAGYLTIGVYDKHSIKNKEDGINNSHLFIDNFQEFILKVKGN